MVTAMVTLMFVAISALGVDVVLEVGECVRNRRRLLGNFSEGA